MNTAVKAICQVYPIFRTTVYAKKPLRPSPGARAKGSLAQNAIISVARHADSAVAVNKALLSIPVSLSIEGFKASMYAIVINVVSPAIISVLGLVLLFFNRKIFSNIAVKSWKTKLRNDNEKR